MMKVEKNEIESRLKALIEKRFNIEASFWDEAGRRDHNLLGDTLMFSAHELLYIFFDVESEFKITISQQEVVDGNFRSFTKITEVIERQLNRKPLAAKAD